MSGLLSNIPTKVSFSIFLLSLFFSCEGGDDTTTPQTLIVTNIRTIITTNYSYYTNISTNYQSNYPSPVWSVNLLANGDFSAGLSGWNTVGSPIVNGGILEYHTSPAETQVVQQLINLDPGAVYKWEAVVMMENLALQRLWIDTSPIDTTNRANLQAFTRTYMCQLANTPWRTNSCIWTNTNSLQVPDVQFRVHKTSTFDGDAYINEVNLVRMISQPPPYLGTNVWTNIDAIPDIVIYKITNVEEL